MSIDKSGFLGLVGVLALTACGGAQPNGAAQASSNPPAGSDTVMTALRAEKLDGDGRPTGDFRAGDVLGSNQNFALYVEVDARRYVYAVQFHNGSGDVLYDGSASPASPKQWVRIPSEKPNDVIQTDDQPGEERIYVVTSPKPLGEAAPEIARAVHALRDTPAETSAPTPAPPATSPAVPAGSATSMALVAPPAAATPAAAPSAPAKARPILVATAAEAQLSHHRERGLIKVTLNGSAAASSAHTVGEDGLTVEVFVFQHK